MSGIVVNTNTLSLTSQNALNKATTKMGTALERMSTGFKVNKAADDAAGLSIATSINTQVRGSKIAKSNIQQGVNVLSTTEGTLNSINDNIDRIRELALQAANGTNSSNATAAIKSEIEARLAEIDKTAAATQFNGLKLLDGSTTSMRLQVGANSDSAENSITVENVFQSVATSAGGLDIALGNILDDPATAAANAADYVDKLDAALKTVSEQKSSIGAYQNRLDSNLSNLTTGIENLESSYSTIMDADIAEESAEYTKQNILQQASASLLAQANQVPSIALSLI